MDEPGGSLSFAPVPGRLHRSDRGVRLRDVVRRARPADDGLGRADRDVGDDVRGIGAVRRGVDPRLGRHVGRGGGRGDLLNARYGPIGVSVAPSLTGRGGPGSSAPSWSSTRRGHCGGRPGRARSEGHRRRRPRPVRRVGRRHGGGRPVRGPPRRSRAARPGRGVPGPVPRPPRAEPIASRPGWPRCWARPSHSPSRRSRPPACRSSPRASRVSWDGGVRESRLVAVAIVGVATIDQGLGPRAPRRQAAAADDRQGHRPPRAGVLAALVAISTFGEDRALVLDERAWVSGSRRRDCVQSPPARGGDRRGGRHRRGESSLLGWPVGSLR